MKCPACSNQMEEKDFGGIHVDVCPGCKGIWFDWFELSKLDEPHEGMGDELLDALQEAKAIGDRSGQIECPKCGVKMHEHRYQKTKEVDVDECYTCAGFFLDAGELKAIRDETMSAEEEDAYINKLVGDIKGYEEMVKDQDRRKTRADAMRNFTKFLRLSYFVEGE